MPQKFFIFPKVAGLRSYQQWYMYYSQSFCWYIVSITSCSEEVGHGHVTAYMNVELYGFSMELPVQKKFCPVLAKP